MYPTLIDINRGCILRHICVIQPITAHTGLLEPGRQPSLIFHQPVGQHLSAIREYRRELIRDTYLRGSLPCVIELMAKSITFAQLKEKDLNIQRSVIQRVLFVTPETDRLP